MKYNVKTYHPNGYMDGTHEFTVKCNKDGTRYVSAKGFGCSRDYPTPNDEEAIRLFLRENGMLNQGISQVM